VRVASPTGPLLGILDEFRGPGQAAVLGLFSWVARGLDEAGIAGSSGSACSSGAGHGSHVLAACGLDGTPLRLSLGWTTTEAEVEHAIAAIAALVPRLRAASAPADLLGLRPVTADH
jgi:cysteine desulfurase